MFSTNKSQNDFYLSTLIDGYKLLLIFYHVRIWWKNSGRVICKPDQMAVRSNARWTWHDNKYQPIRVLARVSSMRQVLEAWYLWWGESRFSTSLFVGMWPLFNSSCSNKGWVTSYLQVKEATQGTCRYLQNNEQFILCLQFKHWFKQRFLFFEIWRNWYNLDGWRTFSSAFY